MASTTSEFQELSVPRDISSVSRDEASGFSNTCSCIPHCCDKYKTRLPHEGWRKWSLFTIISVLILIVVINLGLTLWMMTVMRFSASGMGALRVLSGGIQVNGNTMIMDKLVVSEVSSREGQDVEIRSFGNNITISSQTYGGTPATRISLDPNHVEYFADEMSVRGIDGDLLFHINEEEVAVGAKAFTVLSEAGAVFQQSIQTPAINSIGKDLRIESLTRSITVEAPEEVHVRSNTGNVEIHAHDELHILSSHGSIRLGGKNVVFSQLDKAFPIEGKAKREKRIRIYQLCACDNGKLFLAGSGTPCETTDTDYICS